MGMGSAGRQGSRGREGAMTAAGGPGPHVAAFDFDGTLTVRDSFTAFLRWRAGRVGWIAGLVRLAPALLVYAVRRDRGRLKEAAVRIFLQGLPRERLRQDAERFAAAEMGRLIRPDALEVWTAHGGAGEARVIVTASPEEVVGPFAARLGADLLIGSRLRWTADDRVGAGLRGENCRGEEKVRRLEAAFGPALRLEHAYGDTAGDREMLARARRPHMRAFTGRPARLQRRRK